MKIILPALATLCLAAVPAQAAPLNVVASFSIIADFAEAVGGERIALTTLVGRESDIHVFEPRPADVVAVSRADIILTNGLALEGFLDRLIAASATNGRIVSLAEAIDPIAAEDDHGDHEDEADGHDETHDGANHEDEDDHGHDDAGAHDDEDDHDHADGHDHGAFDPHAWHAVPNAIAYVSGIEAAFCEADPEGCPHYQDNARAYRAELEMLDADIHALMDPLPADRRTIITSHDAFAYFGREYGLAFLSPQGISTEAEPSAAGIAALVRQIREQKAAALFTENVTNPRIVSQIADETGIAIGGVLYSGALSLMEGPAATYIEMMQTNAETIAAALSAAAD